ncbi:MAG: ABC transporter permease subunit, partial [Myxococcota bacterium]
FMSMGTILLFLAPMLTMRLLSEERKSRTYELLMTAPLTTTEIVLGKFLSAFVALSSLVLVTSIYPIILGVMGKGDFEWAPIFTGYLGLLLLMGAFAAIGLFGSTLSENQIVSGVVTFGILLLLWIISWAASSMNEGTLREIVSYLSITEHMAKFSQGVVQVKDIIYYVSLILFGNLLAHRVIESQRWR